MKKVMGTVQSVLIAMILLAIIGTGIILYFQFTGKSAEAAGGAGDTAVSADGTENTTVSDDTTVSADTPDDTASAETDTNIGGSSLPGGDHKDHNYTSTVIKEATVQKTGL